MCVLKKSATIHVLHTALDSMGISEIIALRWLELEVGIAYQFIQKSNG